MFISDVHTVMDVCMDVMIRDGPHALINFSQGMF